MEFIQNLAEYYDELYPVTNSEANFFISLCNYYTQPAKFLQIGCGTGSLAHILAKSGSDVTGLEVSKELLESANLRRRNQLIAIRFFKLSTLDMTRFLGKGFYNVIACVDDRIIFIHDQILLKKFFYDCKILLSPGGRLVLKLEDLSALSDTCRTLRLPIKSSIRVKLSTDIQKKENGHCVINQKLETGNGKMLRIIDNELIYPLTKNEIQCYGQEAGFTQFSFYGSFEKETFTENNTPLICILQ